MKALTANWTIVTQVVSLWTTAMTMRMRAKTTPISIAIKVQTNSPSNEGSKLSTLDSYLEIMKFSLRHSLTKQAVSDLLSLVGLHLPHTSMPSFYKFKKFFLDLYEDISFSTHYCCALCHSTLENANAVCSNGCTGMGTPIEFLTVCVEAQLKRRFQDPTFWKHLQKRFEREREPGSIRDVFDGREYLKHQEFLLKPENISFLLNTDGVSVFNSSTVSLWPVWLAINELPPHVRFTKSNLLLAGLWFGETKPTMSTFLAPFLKEVNQLSDQGILVNTPDGEAVTARARLLMCSFDLPARAIVLNMKQYNGQHGCCYCEDEGVPRPSCHLHRNWPFSTSSTQRTHDSIIANAREVLTSRNDAEKGVKGASILCAHKHFDLSAGAVVDVMHCVFLGVVEKTLLKLWFDGSHRLSPFSIKRKIRQCDERLLKIQIPHDFSRTQRSLNKVKQWKASEYRSWLLYYSLPVLKGILPDPYFTHYALLVAAMHILSSESIPSRSLCAAEKYLLRFYETFSALYGENGCTMNVHMLKHIPQCVQNWGPLWAYSCFSFESINGHLKKHFHGTRCMNAQLAFSHVVLQLLPRNPTTDNPNIVSVSDCSILGPVHTTALSHDIRKAIHDQCHVDVSMASLFCKAVVRGKTYYGQAYRRTVRNSFTVLYVNHGQHNFGFIHYFLSMASFSVAVITPLTITSTYCYPQQLHELCDCIVPVHVVQSSVVIVPVTNLMCKCVCVCVGSNMFVARPPNRLRYD